MIKFLRQLGQKIKRNFRGEKFLCDSCKYNWREVCTKPERPNAADCQDYKKNDYRDYLLFLIAVIFQKSV